MAILNQSDINFESVLPNGQTQPGQETSNLVSTDVISELFTKVKSSDKTFLLEGETALQTVVLTNGSNYELSNVFFNDTMTPGASFVPNSVFINGISFPTYDVVSGFSLANISAGGSINVNYSIIANNPKTNTFIQNYATVSYTAQDPIIGPVDFVENTNTVTIQLSANSLSVVKSVDKNVAKIGEVLTYKSEVKNTGTQLAQNIVFLDNLDAGLEFVEGSVVLNGVISPILNPNVGFAIPNLQPQEINTIEFKARVLNTKQRFIENSALAEIITSGTFIPFSSNTVRTVINNPVIRRVYNIYFCCCGCGNKRDRNCYRFCGRCPHMYRCKCINITKRAICRKKRFCKYCRNRFLVD